MAIFEGLRARVSPVLLIATIAFILSFAMLVASYLLVKFEEEDDVLGQYSQATILSSVAGYEGPAVIEGGTLSLGIERCVHSDEPIQAEVTVLFRNLSPDGTPAVVSYLDRALQPRFPGCNFSLIPMPLPAKVTAGTWRVEGISRAVASSEVRYWASEPFVVVPQR